MGSIPGGHPVLVPQRRGGFFVPGHSCSTGRTQLVEVPGVRHVAAFSTYVAMHNQAIWKAIVQAENHIIEKGAAVVDAKRRTKPMSPAFVPECWCGGATTCFALTETY